MWLAWDFPLLLAAAPLKLALTRFHELEVDEFSAAFSGGPIEAATWLGGSVLGSTNFPLLLAAAPLKLAAIGSIQRRAVAIFSCF